MVHALKNAWQALVPAGALIDSRPIAVDTPLLILTDIGWQSAGKPDQSPDRIQDVAADKAMRGTVSDRLFVKVRQHYFDIHYYWNNLDELKSDMDTRWKDEILMSDETWQRVRALFAQGDGLRRVCLPFRKKITIYHKLLAC